MHKQVEGRSHLNIPNIPHQKAARPNGKKKCFNLEDLWENKLQSRALQRPVTQHRRGRAAITRHRLTSKARFVGNRKEGTEFDDSSDKMTINKPILAPTIFCGHFKSCQEETKTGDDVSLGSANCNGPAPLYNKFTWLLDQQFRGTFLIVMIGGKYLKI